MASAIPSASVPGESTVTPEERGTGGRRHHTEWPQVAAAVIAAAMRSSLPLFPLNDHSCARTNDTSCIPSPVAQVAHRKRGCPYSTCVSCARRPKNPLHSLSYSYTTPRNGDPQVRYGLVSFEKEPERL